jgi:hypothetical protein
VQRLRDQALQRRVGLSILGNRAHPHFQNRPAIGKLLNAADFVAGAFWRQADG